MNTLQGQIKSITTFQQLSRVEIDICGELFQSIVIETPESASYLREGKQIKAKFKETEVILSQPGNNRIGISNSCEGKVLNIEKGELLLKIIIETPAGRISAILPIEAASNLDLYENCDILIFVQSTEIMLSE